MSSITGPAPHLAERLVAAAAREGVSRVLPFWADGGAGGGDPRFAPGRHVLAAYPSSVVRARLEDLGPGGLAHFLRAHLPPPSPDPLPLVVVLLSYDAGRAVPGHERLYPRPARVQSHAHDALPDVSVVRFDGYLTAASERGPWLTFGDTRRLVAALDAEPLVPPRVSVGPLGDMGNESEYRRAFARILTGITCGDHYQVNLARRLAAPIASDGSEAALAAAAWRLHRALRDAQSTAFGALIPIAHNAWMISGSPECLFTFESNARNASSFPIKGTRARDADADIDLTMRQMLGASDKDRAEHVMIVDLVRNDLGRVARPGSVEVPSLFADLPLATVRHLVSEVHATLAPEADLADLVCALFPGGSITGAPKIAAMQALDACEPFARGLYCGSLGVVRGGLEATFSILIRTAVMSPAGLTYAAGGGLVADSTADEELAETELKSAAITRAIAHTRNEFDSY